MIFIDHNLDTVRTRIEGIRDRATTARHEVLDPARIRKMAARIALTTLTAVAAGGPHGEYVRLFLATLMVDWKKGRGLGVVIAMSQPEFLSRYGRERGFTPDSLEGIDEHVMDAIEEMSTPDFNEAIRDWVERGFAGEEDGKQIHEGDLEAESLGEPAMESTVRRVQVIFGKFRATPGHWSAREKILPHLARRYQSRLGKAALPPETVELWLEAVLTAWLEEIPPAIGRALGWQIVKGGGTHRQGTLI